MLRDVSRLLLRLEGILPAMHKNFRRQHQGDRARPGGRAQRRKSRTHRHLNRCPLGGKVRFRDKREAVVVLHSAVASRFLMDAAESCRRQERRVYECKACRGWHLTSQELRHDRKASMTSGDRGGPQHRLPADHAPCSTGGDLFGADRFYSSVTPNMVSFGGFVGGSRVETVARGRLPH